MELADLVPKRFSKWVDSFGEDAGNDMVAWMLGAAMVVSTVVLVVGGCVNSLPLTIIGGAVLFAHILFVIVA